MVPLSGPAWKIYFILFVGSAFAAPQNVTVDDAVLVGSVIPAYIPSPSDWNQGNACSECLAKPDPSYAYNGTWHDTTYNPQTSVEQGIEITFTGSALYIFFILANNITGATTLTNIMFYLDEVLVGTFVHTPSTSTDYQYNASVYANESLVFGEHNMRIEPVNSGNQVLMLFDYLVYTTDTTDDSSSTSPSTSASATAHRNMATVVGGTVGGVTALLLTIASLLYYWRYSRRRGSQRLLRSQKDIVLGSLISLDAAIVRPTPLGGTQARPIEYPPFAHEPMSVRTTLRPPSPPISINPPSTAFDNTAILEEVEQLREEIFQLRYLQKLRMEEAPGYCKPDK